MRSTRMFKATATAASLLLGAVVWAEEPSQPITPEQNRTMPGSAGTNSDAANTVQNAADRMGNTANNAMSGAQGMKADQQLQEQFRSIAQSSEKVSDKLFVIHAACGNMWETELSRVVSEKAQDGQVKQLAQQMVTDHTEANRNLQTPAQALGLQLPTSLSSEKQAELSVYRSMPAEKLEQAYLGTLKADHAKDLTSYSIHQKSAETPELKQYVSQTLPKLREHAQHVNTVAQAKGITSDATISDTSREMK